MKRNYDIFSSHYFSNVTPYRLLRYRYFLFAMCCSNVNAFQAWFNEFTNRVPCTFFAFEQVGLLVFDYVARVETAFKHCSFSAQIHLVSLRDDLTKWRQTQERLMGARFWLGQPPRLLRTLILCSCLRADLRWQVTRFQLKCVGGLLRRPLVVTLDIFAFLNALGTRLPQKCISLLPFISIVHRFRQVFQATSCVRTELLLICSS